MSGRCLVTGGAGFIGSHLAERLLAVGERVRVVDDLSTGLRENVPAGAELLEGDLRDPAVCAEACRDVERIFHLAGRVTIRGSAESFCDDADVNLMGTLRLLAAAGEAGVKRLVFASSMAVYADSPDRRPVAEDHPTEPISAYGISKLAAERSLLTVAPTLGVEPVVLRFFNTYGTRQGYTPYVGVVTIFVTRILRGEPCVIFGDGEQCRDYVHVADVARACVLAGEADAAVGQVLNVGTGTGTSVNRLAERIRTLLGAGELTHAERDPSELVHSVADVGRLRAALGFAPEGRLDDRLAEVVEYLRARGRARGPAD